MQFFNITSFLLPAWQIFFSLFFLFRIFNPLFTRKFPFFIPNFPCLPCCRIYSAIDPLREQLRQSAAHLDARNFQPAIDGYTQALELAPWDASIREARAEAYLGVGNVVHAISDIRQGSEGFQTNVALSSSRNWVCNVCRVPLLRLLSGLRTLNTSSRTSEQ